MAAMLCGLVAASAGAQSIDAIELRVTPDAHGCITEAALRTRLASLNVQVDAAYGLAFAIDAARQPIALEVRRDDVVIATRRFDALPERCAERLQTVALVITLAIEHAVEPHSDQGNALPHEPEAMPRTAEPAQPPVQSAADTDSAQTAPVENAERPSEPREPSLRTVVGGGAAYGFLPDVAALLAVGVELPSGLLRIGLGALVTSEASTSLAGGTALTRLAGARAYGCAIGEGWGIDLQGCAGLVLGVVVGEGRHYEPNANATGTLLAPLLRVGARYPAHGLLSAGVAFEALASVVRPELEVSGNAGSVSSASPFGASASLELVLAVP